MNYRQLIEGALRQHGITDLAKLESHLRGCDLDFPATNEILHSGSAVEVWVRDGGVPGRYGSPPGEDPRSLGIMIEGRHKEVYRVTERLMVLRCTAARFPVGLIDYVGGTGGGTQYVLPPGWLNFVERIP